MVSATPADPASEQQWLNNRAAGLEAELEQVRRRLATITTQPEAEHRTFPPQTA